MATLVLTAAGTLLGGPIGGAIGAFVGRQVDSAVFGPGPRQGPRLKDLSVTTSSYGHPIPRLFGAVRTAGTIIWATDLKESRETSGGGKGKPKTTTYSYAASLAVALSSRPIASVGRIWADGNLLRGADGDLKVGGSIRIYTGSGDQKTDPLIVSDKGASSPAFRGCAYVVFEDIQLGEFGNRIPALTFEVLADEPNQVALGDFIPNTDLLQSSGLLEYVEGYQDEGYPLASSLNNLKTVFPLSCAISGGSVQILNGYQTTAPIPTLPPKIEPAKTNTASNNGNTRSKSTLDHAAFRALRYYDRGRDYQPGVQRAIGVTPPGPEAMFEVPASLAASGARTLCNRMSRMGQWKSETLSWLVAEIDPAIGPGSIVLVPDQPGYWQISTWEWTERAVELTLTRVPPETLHLLGGDTGGIVPPLDAPAMPSVLRAFELPWDGHGDPTEPHYFAAISSVGGAGGASIYLEQGTSLLPIGTVNHRKSSIGTLLTDLDISDCNYLEPDASCEVDFQDPDLVLDTVTPELLAEGANKLLVGDELIQFLSAEKLSATNWRLTGLLRGRGGTEADANSLKPAGSDAILLDDLIHVLDSSQIPASGNVRLAAIGLGDSNPAYADLTNRGLSRSPPSPVHCRTQSLANGDLSICWTRRARGQWTWEDFVDSPLVEEQERYLVGFGPVNQPHTSWPVNSPQLTIPQSQIADVLGQYGPDQLWVRQIGTFGVSAASFVPNLN